jgi:hypothetical protein
MRPFTLKCYTGVDTNFVTDFFILSKGNNSGKPMHSACPNCFVFACENNADREYYFWLIFGLWKAKLFHRILVGSAIQFIRMYETVDLIKEASIKIGNAKDPGKVLDALKIIEKRGANLKEEMNLLFELQQWVVKKLIE